MSATVLWSSSWILNTKNQIYQLQSSAQTNEADDDCWADEETLYFTEKRSRNYKVCKALLKNNE